MAVLAVTFLNVVCSKRHRISWMKEGFLTFRWLRRPLQTPLEREFHTLIERKGSLLLPPRNSLPKSHLAFCISSRLAQQEDRK